MLKRVILYPNVKLFSDRMNSPSMGETDQELEVIWMKNQIEISGRVEITFTEIRMIHFYSLVLGAGIKSGHVVFHALHLLSVTLHSTGVHHKQHHFISCSGNQVHPPVTPPCMWGYTRTKNTSPHGSWEVNVYYLAFHSTLTHLHNLFIYQMFPYVQKEKHIVFIQP